MRDLRVALRTLLRQPGFAAVAVLTLALGIGATTTVFSVVNAVLIRPLPYLDPDRLVTLYETLDRPGATPGPVAAPILLHWRTHATSFEGLGAASGDSFAMTGRGPAESLRGYRLSANLFDLLGIRPALGRGFLPDEESFGNHRVVVVSHEFWQRRWGGDAAILGGSVMLNFEPHQIIGVLPPRTHFPEPGIEVWAPLAFTPEQLRTRHSHTLQVFGRLKPGTSLDQARSEMNVISQTLAQTDPESRDWGAEVRPYREDQVGSLRPTLYVLLGAVGFVLLIACVNIAHLFLTRAAARTREFAVRRALGAGPWAIVRQLLTEGLVIAAVGGLGGLVLARLALAALPMLAPVDLPIPGTAPSLDARVCLFTSALIVGAGLAFGLAPAIPWFTGAHVPMVDGSRSTAGRQRPSFRQFLVVAQLSLSLLLLTGAGLLIRSFLHVLSQPSGFNPENVVTLALALPDQRYPTDADRERFFTHLEDRVRTVPGVTSAGLILGLPLAENQMATAVEVIGGPARGPEDRPQAGYAQVSPDYFRALEIPFVAGRNFRADDRAGTPEVVIVDETFVARFGLGPNPLGRRLRLGDGAQAAEIIGVVRDVRRHALDRPPQGEVYRSYRQRCWGLMSLVVRTHRDTGDLVRAVRKELDGIDPDQPMERIRTLNQILDASVAQRRLSAQALGAFAAAALGLAALGLYGVLASHVAQRTSEIGVRLALGAMPSEILGLVLRQGCLLAVLGSAFGLAGSFALSRWLADFLFGISPLDPLTLGATTALLLATAVLACWIPAHRAASVDPVVALRTE